ncbi:MAG: hypothetical protein HRT82_08730 [Henriciella sp.]|nr:hypothetical protein [Henriciella sp.]
MQMLSALRMAVASILSISIATFLAQNSNAQTVARTNSHYAALERSNSLCDRTLMVQVTALELDAKHKALSVAEFEELVAALRIAAQFECGSDPINIVARVMAGQQPIQNLRTSAADNWTDPSRLVFNEASITVLEKCSLAGGGSIVCADIEVADPLSVTTNEFVSRVWSRVQSSPAVQQRSPQYVSLAFRYNDLLLDVVGYKRMAGGVYKLTDSRVHSRASLTSSVQKSAADDAASVVAEAVAIVGQTNTDPGAGSSEKSPTPSQSESNPPPHFYALLPAVTHCISSFDRESWCSNFAYSGGELVTTRMSEHLHKQAFSIHEVKDYVDPFSGPIASAMGYLSFNRGHVSIVTSVRRSEQTIKTVSSGSDIRKIPGYECFEAPEIGPGCFMLVHSVGPQSQEVHTRLYLARWLETTSWGEKTWNVGIVAFLRPMDAILMTQGLEQIRAEQEELELANARAVANGQPKPFPSFEFANDDMEAFYADLYNGRIGGGSYANRQINQIIFHTYHYQYSEVCRQHLPSTSPIYEWVDDRLVDYEETVNWDGSKTITNYYESYIRDRIPVRHEFFAKFKRISDEFLDELNAEWVENYRGPIEALAFVDTSTPENNYILYRQAVKSNFEGYELDHASFLNQEGCTSPTTVKYEQALNRLELWD